MSEVNRTHGADAAYAKPAVYGSMGEYENGFVGLSKRELFAAMAMQAMTRVDWNEAHPVEVAEKAVKQADCLIIELNKDTKE